MAISVYSMNGSPGMAAADDASSLAARIARVENIVPFQLRGGAYAAQGRNQFIPIDSSGVINGKIDISVASAISFQGAMAPSVIDGVMSVGSSSDSTATIYWDGTNSSRVILIRRSDGTSTTIPGNNLTITGLTPAGVYTAYSYWTPANVCGLGWAQGDSGTPLIAFSSSATSTQLLQAKAAQHLAGREEISSIQWTQPTAGGTSPPVNPVDPNEPVPGLCVRLGTHIEPLGSYGPSEIEELLHPETDWIHLEANRGLVLECTADHPLYREDKKVKACELVEGDFVITRFGEQQLNAVYPFKRACTKVEVRMKFGHLFWANGFLSHNFKPRG